MHSFPEAPSLDGMMDDDWTASGILEKDVFISDLHQEEKETIDILQIFDSDVDGFSPDTIRVKMEPNDDNYDASETSDYHGSSSGSPSSSLSSPNGFKDEPLGLDVHFGSSLFNAPFSPSPTSSHSPTYGMMNGGHSMVPQPHSPLPSVHFSHNHHHHHHMVQHHAQQPSLQMTMNQVFTAPSHQYIANNVPHNFLFKDSTIYEGMGGMGLAAAQQQLKARNKMHEMALRQHLITDQFQNLQSNGDLVLSAEERRTLVQEGYPIPAKYPLSKTEEESLKIVRRKIKNKLSAQESRRKRKEYIDALESRLHCFSEENKTLKHQVHQLEASNRDLQQKLHQYESKD